MTYKGHFPWHGPFKKASLKNPSISSTTIHQRFLSDLIETIHLAIWPTIVNIIYSVSSMEGALTLTCRPIWHSAINSAQWCPLVVVFVITYWCVSSAELNVYLCYCIYNITNNAVNALLDHIFNQDCPNLSRIVPNLIFVLTVVLTISGHLYHRPF